ncbi:Mobile element protein [Candidatus Enterovibrio escicola]|uniref:Mobile element protein n=1 Tax=Candidatus Enterovibrio escicola TaxID=1927127 RepID=A0A2A5T6W5_9GAMM|nr:Mobile element protein [Candidatus Enterovibrio escacola]
MCYLTHHQARPTEIAFVDSFKLQVYHNLRILRHHVFKCTDKRGKGTIGWLYGFKLHLIINDQGGIISVKVTTDNECKKHIPNRAFLAPFFYHLYG